MSGNRKKWQFWAPDIDTKGGGVGACSAFILRALMEVLPDVRFDVRLRNGQMSDSRMPNGRRCRAHSVASLPERLRPVALSLGGIWSSLFDRPSVGFTSHINFLPALHAVRSIRGTKSIGLLLGCEVWDLGHKGRVEALRKADRLWSISNYTRQRVARELDIDAEEIDLLPLTFDHDRFEIREKSPALLKRHGIAPGSPVLLTVARLSAAEQYKGQDRVIRQLPDLLKEYPRLQYVIAGRGDDQLRLEKLARECGVAEHVIFAGFVPDEEICDYYNLADVFVMPSTGEGFGIVFLESAVCGRPVIAGNRDASPEATGNGKFGWIVDPYDGGQLAAAIGAAISGRHDNELVKNREALRREVLADYGWPTFRGHVERNVNTFLELQQDAFPLVR